MLNGPVMASDSKKYVSKGLTVDLVPFAQEDEREAASGGAHGGTA